MSVKLSLNELLSSSTLTTDLTVDGHCSNCGECCGMDWLPVTTKELRTIKKFVKTHHIKPARNVPLVEVNTIDVTCPFRDNTKKSCTIYPVRPLICRQFLCSQKAADISQQKLECCRAGQEISFRAECFDDSSVVDCLMILHHKIRNL